MAISIIQYSTGAPFTCGLFHIVHFQNTVRPAKTDQRVVAKNKTAAIISLHHQFALAVFTVLFYIKQINISMIFLRINTIEIM